MQKEISLTQTSLGRETWNCCYKMRVFLSSCRLYRIFAQPLIENKPLLCIIFATVDSGIAYP